MTLENFTLNYIGTELLFWAGRTQNLLKDEPDTENLIRNVVLNALTSYSYNFKIFC